MTYEFATYLGAAVLIVGVLTIWIAQTNQESADTRVLNAFTRHCAAIKVPIANVIPLPNGYAPKVEMISARGRPAYIDVCRVLFSSRIVGLAAWNADRGDVLVLCTSSVSLEMRRFAAGFGVTVVGDVSDIRSTFGPSLFSLEVRLATLFRDVNQFATTDRLAEAHPEQQLETWTRTLLRAHAQTLSENRAGARPDHRREVDERLATLKQESSETRRVLAYELYYYLYRWLKLSEPLDPHLQDLAFVETLGDELQLQSRPA